MISQFQHTNHFCEHDHDALEGHTHTAQKQNIPDFGETVAISGNPVSCHSGKDYAPQGGKYCNNRSVFQHIQKIQPLPGFFEIIQRWILRPGCNIGCNLPVGLE